MMLTLLGSLIGFLGSAVPSVVDHFKNKENNKKQIEFAKLQTQLAEKNAEIDLTKFHAMALDNEHARLIQHDIALTKDSGTLSWLRKSVRPLITYMFFALFAAVKVSALVVTLDNFRCDDTEQQIQCDNNITAQEFNQALLVVWDDETQGMFAAIISFWFGTRALERQRVS